MFCQCMGGGGRQDRNLKNHEVEMAKEMHKNSKLITRKMQSSDLEAGLVRKYLLLGAGSCDKSTLFKQLKCIYGNGFCDTDIRFANQTIRLNCVLSILLLLRKSMDLSA